MVPLTFGCVLFGTLCKAKVRKNMIHIVVSFPFQSLLRQRYFYDNTCPRGGDHTKYIIFLCTHTNLLTYTYKCIMYHTHLLFPSIPLLYFCLCDRLQTNTRVSHIQVSHTSCSPALLQTFSHTLTNASCITHTSFSPLFPFYTFAYVTDFRQTHNYHTPPVPLKTHKYHTPPVPLYSLYLLLLM
jgi:hypothetical protein